jgi:hypothetical protein
MKRKEIEHLIKKTAITVKAIETLRSRLFVKEIPFLMQEHCCKVVQNLNDKSTWVVISIDKDYLVKIERVILDYTKDIGEHIQFYDVNNNQLLPVPKDIIALVTLNDAAARDAVEIEEDVNDIGWIAEDEFQDDY